MVLDYSHVRAGVISGVLAGVVFGALMGMQGMLPMIASLVGASSALIGFVVHLVFSAVIGALFSLVLGHEALVPGKGIMVGLIWGAVWWFLGPLLIMPLWLGMGVQLSLTGMQAALPSLWGHLVYGFILGLVYQRVSQSPMGAVRGEQK